MSYVAYPDIQGAVAYLGFHKGGGANVLLPPLSLSSPPLSSPRSRAPYIQVGGLESAVSSPSPSPNRIWCILALKSDIWWQQFS